MRDRICAVCGDSFHVSPSKVHKRVHCSRACKSRAPVKTRVSKVNVPCQHCQRLMLLWPCHAKTKVFCSDACRRAHHRRQFVCAHCGRAVTVLSSARATKYCSKACRVADDKKHGRGKVTRQCRQCSGEYEVYPSRIKVLGSCL